MKGPLERACIAVIDNLREQGDLMPDCGDPEWAQVGGAFRVEPVVRAVLEAIRDVDASNPAMLVAGKTALYSCSEDPELEDARECFHAMIDVALGDER